MKKQSFAKGAFLLAVATGLGKVFSAIFKIPLDRFFLHEDGMAVFNGTYNIYMFFFAAATAGFPLAISRLVASSKTKEEENSILSTALIFMILSLGSVCALIMIFSDHIALGMGLEDASFGLRIMAPALLFCAFTASFKGYFQGKMLMTASALSQVADAFGRLFAGFIFVYIFSGKSVSTVAAGALTGVPFGAFLSALILLVAFVRSKNRLSFSFSSKIFCRIISLAIPVTLTTSLHAVFNVIDTASVVPVLKLFSHENAQIAFGSLGRSAMLYALPVSIATAVAASALPAVAENIKVNDKHALNENISMATRLSLVVSIPCAAGFIAVPHEIFTLLFDSATNFSTLAAIAPSAVFLSVGCTLSGILQGMGKTKYTVIAALCAIVTKISINIALMRTWGVVGASGATSIAYFVFMLVLIICIYQYTPLRFSGKDIVVKPLLCGLICFVTALASSQFFPVFVSIPVAAVFYIVSVFIFRLITKEEINQIFSAKNS